MAIKLSVKSPPSLGPTLTLQSLFHPQFEVKTQYLSLELLLWKTLTTFHFDQIPHSKIIEQQEAQKNLLA
jgi:hypothetical protein